MTGKGAHRRLALDETSLSVAELTAAWILDWLTVASTQNKEIVVPDCQLAHSRQRPCSCSTTWPVHWVNIPAMHCCQ